ncbi:hypothetical protein NUW54_g11806 [Trametes sanguinea]|uniref:Uncharacterized protein n=1 Tax=Trametes sanguinea TaxID=158606 RepID=A0ACC1N7J6_9APHY|nr:hypothetical protein NUW54_g11806 [Trametes sanguinea]
MYRKKRPYGTTTHSVTLMVESGRRIGCWERIQNIGSKSTSIDLIILSLESRGRVAFPPCCTRRHAVQCFPYPKQQRLLALKKAAVKEHALPPTFLPFSELSTLHPTKFDVILIDPPFSSSFSWDDLQNLPIPALAADPSFVFMWVGSGSGEGLERGREVMGKWGFRRCEDIVWVKTNKTTNRGPGTDPPTTSLLTRTKQHCLMGIRGTVRRSNDSWFVHCNVDTDVLIWEGDQSDPTLKPSEMYTLIENFCLGLRRLEIFGRARTARRGG